MLLHSTADTEAHTTDAIQCVKETTTTNHIRRKVESKFGGSIHIFPDDKGKLIPYLMTISIAKLYQATK